jgi:hypothetical protein
VAGPDRVEYISEGLHKILGMLSMRGVAFVLACGLIVCSTGIASASSEWRKWQTPAGTSPSKNEFAAVIAACEDRAKNNGKIGPIEGCLADYGLRRIP